MSTVENRLRFVLWLGLAAALGFGAGYLIFRGPPPGGTSSTPGAAGARGDRDDHGRGGGRRAPQGDTPGGPGAALQSPAAREALARQLRERNQGLVQENQRLRARLDEERRERAFREGTPAPWPDQVPDRLRKDALTAAMNTALREAGLKGEVSDVDCKEYPCVLAGHLDGLVDSGQFKRLLRQQALTPYRGDHAETSVSASTQFDARGRPVRRTQFGVAFQLAGPPGTEPEVQRTIVRMRQILDSTRER